MEPRYVITKAELAPDVDINSESRWLVAAELDPPQPKCSLCCEFDVLAFNFVDQQLTSDYRSHAVSPLPFSLSLSP